LDHHHFQARAAADPAMQRTALEPVLRSLSVPRRVRFLSVFRERWCR